MSGLVSFRTTLFAFSICALFLTAPLFSQSGTTNKNLSNHLVGAWKLVSLEKPSANGAVHPVDCDGLFVFSNDGKASVQVMYRNSQAGNDYAQGGYEASYGSYEIDDGHTFTFHIDGALVRTLLGKDLKRAYEISGNRLIVRSTNPNEKWRVVWERY